MRVESSNGWSFASVRHVDRSSENSTTGFWSFSSFSFFLFSENLKRNASGGIRTRIFFPPPPASYHRRHMWEGSNVFDRRWENHTLYEGGLHSGVPFCFLQLGWTARSRSTSCVYCLVNESVLSPRSLQTWGLYTVQSCQPCISYAHRRNTRMQFRFWSEPSQSV